MKKVLLIEPPVIIRRNEFHQCLPPLGLLYLASTLRANGYQVKVLDACVEGWDNRVSLRDGFDYKGLTDKEIKNIVVDFQPEVVGISWKFTRQEQAFALTLKAVKSAQKDSLIVVGGAHPTSCPQEVLEKYPVDYVVLGEGEKVLLELLKKALKSDKAVDLDGVAYKQKGEIVVKENHNFSKNLDELPFPARDLLSLDKYLKDNLTNSAGDLVKAYPKGTIITSRGCPERCSFCAIRNLWGRRYRARSPENVVAEIEEMVNKYGYKEIHFLDDNLTLKKERALKIFELITEKNLKFYWRTPNGISTKTITQEMVSLMKKSGCYRVAFGIESGNQLILNQVIKKGLNLEKVREVNKWFKKEGIEREGFFIIGMPGETKKTVFDSINFAQELELDDAAFFLAQPYPGTELYKQCLEENYLKTEAREFLMTSNPSIETPLLSKNEVKQLQRIANYTFALKKASFKDKMIIYLKYALANLLLQVFGLKRVLLNFLHANRKAGEEKQALS